MNAREREALRARVFLRAVLPLLETVLAEQPALAKWFAGVNAAVQLRADGTDVGATLRFVDGRLTVSPELGRDAAVKLRFRDLAAMNSFFAGKPVLPAVDGLRHPLLIARVVRLLVSLQLLQPAPPPARADERALKVRLLLTLASRALGQLALGGHPEMVELVADSPDRVYQWSVQREGIGAWLRMERGRVKVGTGTYARRKPFVHFVFPDADAALRVLTATESQMSGVRDGSIQTLGSPEYVRKVALLMQKVDELLTLG
jgi:hypothetical protein